MSETLAVRAKFAQKLLAVMSEVGSLDKDGRNTAQKYDYVSEAAVKRALRPLFVKHGLAPILNITDVSNAPFQTSGGSTWNLITLRIEMRLIDSETGYAETFNVIGQGADSGDKGVYKAITGAVRHHLMNMLLIPTGDDPEADVNTDAAGAGSVPHYGASSTAGSVPADDAFPRGWPFGKEKGKALADVSDNSLEWALGNAFDVNHEKFGESNKRSADAVRAEISRRAGGVSDEHESFAVSEGDQDDIPF